MQESVYLRVIDASANRAREALRVIEDFVRFVRDDPFLVEELKVLRHRLARNVLKFSLKERLFYRETQADVGTRITTSTEFHRESLQSVLEANFSRLQESLRSLEEFSKLTQPEAAHEFEQMRYASYTLQRAIFFIVTNDSPLRSVEPKTLTKSKAEVWETAGFKFTSDLERAQSSEFAGFLCVHASNGAVKLARNALGTEKFIGVQVETVEEARKVLLDGVDFLAANEKFVKDLRSITTLPVFVISFPEKSA